MSLYQENKIFINKYRAALLAEFKKHEHDSSRISVYCNDASININMWVTTLFDNEIYITEANKRLFFCVKLREKSRKLVTMTEDFQKDVEVLGRLAYINTLGMYSTSRDVLNEIRNYLISKGKVKDINGKPLKDVDEYQLLYWIQDNPIELEGYPEVKRCESFVKELKDCPVKIFRHPDVLKYIKDEELIPVSWIETESYGSAYLTHPVKNAGSRKSFAFTSKDDISYLSNSNEINRMVHRAYVYTPFSFWVCILPVSDVVNRQKTLSYNYQV